jgi:hypothetical protein
MIQSSVLSVCLHHRKQHTQREKEEEEKILCTYPIKGTSPAITPRVFSVCLFEVRLDVFPLLVSIFFRHEKLYNRPKLHSPATATAS